METKQGLRRFTICLLLLVSMGVAGARDLGGHSGSPRGNQPAADWNYGDRSGPPHWGKLSDAYSNCEAGKQQSPVEITFARHAPLPPLAFHYRSQPLDVYHTGKVIRIKPVRGSYLTLEGTRFDLKEIIFHTPSEHMIRGRRGGIEAQFLHRDPNGNLVVVAVLMEGSNRFNSTVSRIWQHLPRKAGANYFDRQIGINATFLLPTNRSYFTYSGSLTTPPCTEGVRWFVFQNPVYVSHKQVEKLAEVTGNNARPLQSLNSRTILSNRP